jgi:hypothetical protein
MDNFVTLYFEVAGSLCSVHFHSNVHIRRCRKCLYLLHVLFINYKILTWWEFSFHVLVGSSAAQTWLSSIRGSSSSPQITSHSTWLLPSTAFPIHDAVTIHCYDIFLATKPSQQWGKPSWWWPFGGRNIDWHWHQSTCGIDCEDEGSVVIQNIRKYLPRDSANHLRTIFSTSTMRTLKV